MLKRVFCPSDETRVGSPTDPLSYFLENNEDGNNDEGTQRHALAFVLRREQQLWLGVRKLERQRQR